MKNHSRNLFIALAWPAFLTLNFQPSTALAQGTAFTYQGQLQNSGSPASGTYNLTFTLYTANTGGAVVAGPVTTNGVAITNGLFTVTIDFGSGVWNGATNWLQIGVETNGGPSFTELSPRQELTPTPYAIYAGTAGSLQGLVVQMYSGGEPNLIGGSQVNFVSPGIAGATISGGGSPLDPHSGAPETNSVTADFGTVGGGDGNTAGYYATVAGGFHNAASGPAYGAATVGGGEDNTASGDFATVSGGFENTASGSGASVGGGGYDGSAFSGNLAQGNASSVGGGLGNEATNTYATIGGGYNNIASGLGAVVAGGGYDAYDFPYGNLASGPASAVVGGVDNKATSLDSFVGAGVFNTAAGQDDVVAGGSGNSATTYCSVIGGGLENNVSAFYATVPGGYANLAGGLYSFAAGQNAQALHNGAFVWADDSSSTPFASTGTNQFLIRATGGVGIGTTNPEAQLQVVNANTTTTSPGIRSLSGGGQAGELQRLGFYSAAGEFVGANGVIGVGTSNQVDSYGVLGVATGNGLAVYGYYADTAGGSGYGVYAASTSTNGTALYTIGASSTSPALTIGKGAIHVSGAGVGTSTAAFVQVATAATISIPGTLWASVISNPLCNGDPNAILLVTVNADPGGGATQSDTHPINVAYFGSVNRWAIIHADEAAITTNTAYNVLIIKN